MTQEQKELLLKDLCARIPYYVKCNYNDIYNKHNGTLMSINNNRVTIDGICKDIVDVKPYLFPMSSMTEEQKKEYTHIVNYISSDDTDNWKEGEFIYVEQLEQMMHFYHKNHLDYRGLIEKGLSLDATELNVY